MTRHLVLIACVVLGFSAGPALAFKNIEGCDIVAFAGKDPPVAIPAERWQAYGDSLTTVLEAAPGADAAIAAWRALANQLIKKQKALLGSGTLADLPTAKLIQYLQLGDARVVLSARRVKVAVNADFLSWLVDDALPVLGKVAPVILPILL